MSSSSAEGEEESGEGESRGGDDSSTRLLLSDKSLGSSLLASKAGTRYVETTPGSAPDSTLLFLY